MLYTDIHLPIPGGPRYETQVQGNRTYLYFRVRSYRVNGKLRHERVLIGRVFKDEQTQLSYFSPNEKFYDLEKKPQPTMQKIKGPGRTRRTPAPKEQTYHDNDGKSIASGFVMACYAIIKEQGLDKILEEVFGLTLTRKIMAAASFFAGGAPGGLSDIDNFTRQNMCFTERIITSQDLSDLYSSITSSMRRDFFRAWISKCKEDDCICYDVTSISGYSKSLPIVAYGYNRDKEQLPQINVGMFCTIQTGIPVFFAEYCGSINDFTNLPYVLRKAEEAGIKKSDHITLVMDGGFAVKTALEHTIDNKRFDVIVGAPLAVFKEVRELTLEWRNNPKLAERAFILDGEAFRHHERLLQIGSTQLRLLLYKSPASTMEQETTLTRMISRQEAVLRDKKAITEEEARDYAQFFNICRRSDGTFTFSQNQTALAEALSLCGCFALLCTRPDLKGPDVLSVFRAKDCVEKAFAVLKNDVLHERMRCSSAQSINGKLFLSFIGLIIRRLLDFKLRDYISKERFSLDSAISRLGAIRCRKEGRIWVLDEAPTRQQKEMAEILNLPLNFLDAKAS